MPRFDYFRAPDGAAVVERMTADPGSPLFPGDGGLAALDGIPGNGVDSQVILAALLTLVARGTRPQRPRLS